MDPNYWNIYILISRHITNHSKTFCTVFHGIVSVKIYSGLMHEFIGKCDTFHNGHKNNSMSLLGHLLMKYTYRGYFGLSIRPFENQFLSLLLISPKKSQIFEVLFLVLEECSTQSRCCFPDIFKILLCYHFAAIKK